MWLFKFDNIARKTIVVDLERSTTGADTFGDPFLGLFVGKPQTLTQIVGSL
ncbi:MAG: hypothetical protein ACI9C4_001230 [Paraglaciecola sp.]|jgi:hypothetical protein